MVISGNLVRLNWDSDFFGKEIANFEQTENTTSLTLSMLDQYDFAQAKINAHSPDSINQLQSLGFKYVEGEIVFQKQTDFQCPQEEIIPAKYDDLDQLRNIVNNAYNHSRFCLPWFALSDKERFYATWVEKAVQGQFDDICLCIKNEEKVLGFITLKKVETICRIGLIAVAVDARGQQVGSKLMQMANNYALKQQLTTIQVATQLTNIPAINFYNKLDYKTHSISHWLYR
jgi:dTDP-4-amino-4,6-dideoxy-D-galactose acyltransferase